MMQVNLLKNVLLYWLNLTCGFGLDPLQQAGWVFRPAGYNLIQLRIELKKDAYQLTETRLEHFVLLLASHTW